MGLVCSMGGDSGDTCVPCLPYPARDYLLHGTLTGLQVAVPVPSDLSGFMCLSDANIMTLVQICLLSIDQVSQECNASQNLARAELDDAHGVQYAGSTALQRYTIVLHRDARGQGSRIATRGAAVIRIDDIKREGRNLLELLQARVSVLRSKEQASGVDHRGILVPARARGELEQIGRQASSEMAVLPVPDRPRNQAPQASGGQIRLSVRDIPKTLSVRAAAFLLEHLQLLERHKGLVLAYRPHHEVVDSAAGVPWPARLYRSVSLLFNDLDQASTGQLSVRVLRKEAQVASAEAVRSLSFASIGRLVPCMRPGKLQHHEFAAMLHSLCCSTDDELMHHLFLVIADTRRVVYRDEPQAPDAVESHASGSRLTGGPPTSGPVAARADWQAQVAEAANVYINLDMLKQRHRSMYSQGAAEEDVSLRILLETLREKRKSEMIAAEYHRTGRLLGLESFLRLVRRHPIIGYGIRYARGFFYRRTTGYFFWESRRYMIKQAVRRRQRENRSSAATRPKSSHGRKASVHPSLKSHAAGGGYQVDVGPPALGWEGGNEHVATWPIQSVSAATTRPDPAGAPAKIAAIPDLEHIDVLGWLKCQASQTMQSISDPPGRVLQGIPPDDELEAYSSA